MIYTSTGPVVISNVDSKCQYLYLNMSFVTGTHMFPGCLGCLKSIFDPVWTPGEVNKLLGQ